MYALPQTFFSLPRFLLRVLFHKMLFPGFIWNLNVNFIYIEYNLRPNLIERDN